MDNQNTIPSQLSPVSTMPSVLEPETEGTVKSRRRGGSGNPVWMLVIVALALVLLISLVF